MKLCVEAMLDKNPLYWVMYWAPCKIIPGSRVVKCRQFWTRNKAIDFANIIEPFDMIQYDIVGY